METYVARMHAVENALLEDLRVTKQHVLQRGSPICPTNGNKTTTEPKFWPQNSTDSSDMKLKSQPRRPLQENLAKLDRILSDLDAIDGETDSRQLMRLLT
ncbi:hypothetical protein TSMEX_001250 [Taenia solium]|eukprot:TsM_000847600 transcript=TsM_000847600 gene=TsM_000847600